MTALKRAIETPGKCQISINRLLVMVMMNFNNDGEIADDDQSYEKTYQSPLGFLVQHLDDSGMGGAHVCQVVRPHAVERGIRDGGKFN